MAEYDDLIYTHQKTGHHYRIVHFAVDEATLEPVVVYKDVMSGALWVRPCAKFFDGRFTTGGAEPAGAPAPAMKSSMEASADFEALVDDRVKNGVWPGWVDEAGRRKFAANAIKEAGLWGPGDDA